MKEKAIQKDSFGEEWPFTVSEGILVNRDDAILFRVDGIEYGLNGQALEQGYPHIKPLWKDNDNSPSCMTDRPKMKMSLTEIINLGSNI